MVGCGKSSNVNKATKYNTKALSGVSHDGASNDTESDPATMRQFSQCNVFFSYYIIIRLAVERLIS